MILKNSLCDLTLGRQDGLYKTINLLTPEVKSFYNMSDPK